MDASVTVVSNAGPLRFYFAEMARRQDIWISHTLVERLLRELGL